MPTQPATKHPQLRLGLWALLVLLGLCSIFASVVTAAEAWQEHAQARWPQITARVYKSYLRQTSTGRRQAYYIDCELSYMIGSEENVAKLYSAHVPSPEVPQYPPNQIAPFAEWVDEHPPGTSLVVRYDPANHSKAVLTEDYMPRGGPRTPKNIRLLEVFAGSFLVLLALALITRPRPLGYPSGGSPD